MKVTSALVLETLDKMIAERCKRQADATMAGTLRDSSAAEMPMQHQHHTPATTAQVSSSMATQENFQQEVTEEEPLPSDANRHGGPSGGPNAKPLVQRDAGVSDTIWYQLQLDRKKAEDAEKEHQRLLEEERKLAQWLKDCADAQRQKELEELARKRKEIEEKRRQEAKEKQMLMQMGRCPVGYEWIKQANGYRCAGGSHWIGDGDVANMMGQSS